MRDYDRLLFGYGRESKAEVLWYRFKIVALFFAGLCGIAFIGGAALYGSMCLILSTMIHPDFWSSVGIVAALVTLVSVVRFTWDAKVVVS